MKQTIFFIALLLLSTTAFSQTSFEDKVKEMLELSGSGKNYDMLITSMVAQQKKMYKDLPDDFWPMMEKEFLTTAKNLIYEEVVPIYMKHMTEENIDEIIAFYKSPGGRALREASPLIMQESMEAGAEIGEKIAMQVGEMIIERVEKDKLIRFEKSYTGCEDVRTGKFTVNSENGEIKITRTKTTQKEVSEKGTTTSDVVWLDECRGKLLLRTTNDPKIEQTRGEAAVFNITKTNAQGYYYSVKGEFSSYIIEGFASRR